MAVLLDTDVVIHMRDGDGWVIDQVGTLDPPLFLSAITRVELENGVWRDPTQSERRQCALELVLRQIAPLDFGAAEIVSYGAILAMAGFSRRKVSDRMTAATALAADLPLATFNGRDFRDIPGLQLIEWSRPGD